MDKLTKNRIKELDLLHIINEHIALRFGVCSVEVVMEWKNEYYNAIENYFNSKKHRFSLVVDTNFVVIYYSKGLTEALLIDSNITGMDIRDYLVPKSISHLTNQDDNFIAQLEFYGKVRSIYDCSVFRKENWLVIFGECSSTKAPSNKLEVANEALNKNLKELSYSQRRYQALFANMENVFALYKVIIGHNGAPVDLELVEANPASERLIDREEDVLHKRITEIFPDLSEEPIDWIRELSDVALTGRPKVFESYSKMFDRWFRFSVYSPERELVALIATDITEGKQREKIMEQFTKELKAVNKQLLVSEGRLRGLIKALSGSINDFLTQLLSYIKEISGCSFVGIKVVNQGVFINYQFKDDNECLFWQSEIMNSENCICQNLLKGNLPKAESGSITAAGSFWRRNLTMSSEQLCLRTDKKFCSLAVIPARYGNNLVAAVHLADQRLNVLDENKIEIIEAIAPLIGTVISRQAAEKALKNSERKYRHLVEDANVIIISLDMLGKIAFINSYGAKLLGYSPEQLVSCSFQTILPEFSSSGENMWNHLHDMLANPAKYQNSLYEMVKITGQRIWVEWTYRCYPNGENNEHMVCVGVDVTKRQQAVVTARLNYERSRRRALLNDLLDKRIEQDDFLAIAKQEGFYVRSPWICCFVEIELPDKHLSYTKDKYEEWQAWLDVAVDLITSRFGGLVWSNVNGIAIVQHANSAKRQNKLWIQDVEDTIKDIFRFAKFSIGVSETEYVLQTVFRQAYEAASAGPIFRPDNHVHHWRELGMARLVIDQAKSADGSSFIQQYLGPVFEHPASVNENWIGTLKAIMSGQPAHVIAERLHVHPKTIGFRKRKIEKAPRST